jgi:hypothetical protein
MFCSQEIDMRPQRSGLAFGVDCLSAHPIDTFLLQLQGQPT